jgi:cytochrome oxidase Cu insertion factor (SCO1/SenC/PrrC family)
MNRIPTILFGFSAVLALCAAVLAWRLLGPGAEFGSAGRPAPIGGAFRLVDQNGHARSDSDFRGRWIVVYFGYSYCPDVCPATLQEIADALHRLGPRASQIVPLFITLDPERDHPLTLKKYLAAFGPEFVGLTGTPAQIARIAHAYGVYYAKHPLPGGTYSIDHTGALYLLGPSGQFEEVLDEHEGPAKLAKEINRRL